MSENFVQVGIIGYAGLDFLWALLDRILSVSFALAFVQVGIIGYAGLAFLGALLDRILSVSFAFAFLVTLGGRTLLSLVQLAIIVKSW